MKSILDYIKVFKNIETYKGPAPRTMAQGGRIGFDKAGIVNLRGQHHAETAAAKFKSIVDEIFRTGDFKDFKAILPEHQKKFKLPSGKFRQSIGGKTPPQYIKKFNKAIKAGPGSELFEDLKATLGRTTDEILDLEEKRPGGKVDPKLRSTAAKKSFPESRKKTLEQKAETQAKSKIKRLGNIAYSKVSLGSNDFRFLELLNKKKLELNAFFKEDPNRLFNTDFGKQTKDLIDIRFKDGEIIYDRRPKKYYIDLINKPNYGIYSEFDVSPARLKKKSLRYPINLNLAPSQFNSAFIEQVDRYFRKNTNQEALNKVSEFLKSKNLRLNIPDVGIVGAAADVAFDTKTGTSPRINKTLENLKVPKNLKPKLIDTQRAGAFDDVLKSKAVKKGWSGFRKVGGPWEAGFIGLDFINNLDRMDADTAFKTALENATLGIYKGGQRTQWEDFKTAGKELGHNPENLSEIKSIMDLEKMLAGEKQVLNEMIAYNAEEGSGVGLRKEFPKEEIEWRKEVVARLEKEFENKQNTFWSKDNAQDLVGNYQDTVSYIARKEYNKNWEDKKFRVNTDMGPIGSPLWSAITDWGVIGDKKGIPYPKTLLPQNLMETTSVTRPYVRALRKIPGIGSWFDPTSKEAKLSAMSDEEKAQRAKELNVQEQYYHPVTGNTMTYSQMEPYYDKYYASGGRAGYMGGGIAGIRKPSAIAPTGGPMSQGLRSLYNNVKKS